MPPAHGKFEKVEKLKKSDGKQGESGIAELHKKQR
jgi:hypothetical protein